MESLKPVPFFFTIPGVVRLVLFDIDGTLIRSGGAGEKAFAKVFASEFNIQNGTAGIAFAGRTDPSIVREFFRRYQIEASEKHFRRFFDSYVFWLDQLLSQIDGRILPGVRETLSRFAALPEPPAIGLLTGNIRLGAQIKLVRYGLWDHFQTGGFGDDHEDRNEIAAIARSRGEELLRRKLHGEEILVIGDTPCDIACAKAIGARVLAVATGSYPLARLQEQRPTWVLDDLSQLCLEEICE